MKVLFCSSEVTPYAKTGGLADVSAALPDELLRQGVECPVVMPLYQEVKAMGLPLAHLDEIPVLTGTGINQVHVYRHDNTYFIDSSPLFDRMGLYSYAGSDYPDNLERFALFSRACVELARIMGDVDVVHCNDWQTALVIAYLKALDIEGIRSVFTIHNLAYQGAFDPSLWPMLFLPREYFHPECMEFFGRINIMKAGIVFADAVNTVSPTYAREIQTPEYGSGLDGLLRSVAGKLTGIANGIDTRAWDPESDALLDKQYSRGDLSGKDDCKKALQEMFSLDRRAVPLFGLISRLVEQKGIDLVIEAIPAVIALGAQVVVLGNGNPGFERRLTELQRAFSGKLGIHVGFDETKAHAIEAGADFFLMPSRFEPCGLNQMISMRYGTIPIVTGVGGLKDTVTAYGEGDRPFGLRVSSPAVEALLDAVRFACRIYGQDKDLLDAMKKNAMARDVSWAVPAGEYSRLYCNLKDFEERSR
ncbi:MAG TPA: glycogen synthase GlgA [Deltaproteobacteria bacterium]|nr:glycogen synthase GlgA [Deltaproteobacteria bacterium]